MGLPVEKRRTAGGRSVNPKNATERRSFHPTRWVVSGCGTGLPVRAWTIVWARILALALVCAAATAGPGNARPLPRSANRIVSVGARIDGVQRIVPDSYLGFSLEWTELPAFESDTPAFARLLGQLSVAGQRVPLRVGGETADNTYWAQPKPKLPQNPYVVHGDYFTQLGELARATPLSLLFDLNLAARSPRMAQALSREVRQTVPSSSVTGFEIGNEPDLYIIGLVGPRFIKRGADSPFQWALHYGPAAYASDFGRYVSALQTVWPRVRYAGPSQASGRTDFARRTLKTGKLSMLTVHRYQFNACPGPTGPAYPSQSKYLSVAASRTFAARSEPLVTIAHRAGLPVRVTEFGSAICGGRAGLTNTYATALWAADTIFNLMAQGIDGINVHLRESYPNSALNASSAGIAVNPLYYGMLLVTKTLGSGAQLMRVTTTPANAGVAVFAVRDRGGATRVLLLNESRHDVSTKLSLGTLGDGTIERLTASAPGATTNVQFAGQSLDSTGNWTGTRQVEPASDAHGTFAVSIPRYSAALLTVPR